MTFEFATESTLDVEVTADKNELHRVLTNLGANAISHNNKGHRITFKTNVQNSDLIVSIKDDGEGIPKNDIPKMFQRFSQVSDRRESVGTGLGLYLSRQIIEAHNGKIWLESDRSKGSEFFFLLPNSVSKKAISSTT